LVEKSDVTGSKYYVLVEKSDVTGSKYHVLVVTG